MNGRSRVRTIASVFAVVLRLAFAASTTTGQTNPARLTSVDLIDTSSENIRIELTIDGEVGGVATLRLGDGRYVFDLEPIAWEGPTRRVNPHAPGIREYRYSQFSRKPLITRFVVEVDSLWSCVHTREPEGIIVACGGAPLQGPASATETIAVVRGLELSSPLTRLDAEGLIERSIGFTPQDVVRDGLPHFGSTRDDWIGKPRPHKGLDIYVDLEAVQAVAAGTVVGTGLGQRAGGWATIDHGKGIQTLYVHISGPRVTTGDQVSRGQQIAFVDGAAGNAVEPQLHFELRLDGEAVDPVPYIYELAPEELRARIAREQRRLEVLERERAAQVRQSSGK